MKISKNTTLQRLAAIITKALNAKNISCVLVGGSVVSIYTDNNYKSKDLDFISPADHREIKAIMKQLGFSSIGKDFHHPHTPFTVEFPTGPLAIGDRIPVQAEGEIKVYGTKIILLSPTQCVMDRLTWFYHNRDRQCLEQAVAVGRAHPVKLREIESWSKDEGQGDKFKIFLKHLKKK